MIIHNFTIGTIKLVLLISLDNYNNCTKYKTTANRYIGIHNILMSFGTNWLLSCTQYDSLSMFQIIIHIPFPPPLKNVNNEFQGIQPFTEQTIVLYWSSLESKSRLLYYTGVVWKVGVDYCIILEYSGKQEQTILLYWSSLESKSRLLYYTGVVWKVKVDYSIILEQSGK